MLPGLIDRHDVAMPAVRVDAVAGTGAHVRTQSRWMCAVSAMATPAQEAALGALPGVERAQWNPERHAAELTIARDVDPQDVMRAAIALMPVRTVELRKTTLDDVFVELVGEAMPSSEESGNG
jgi:ABC-type uncharacterized transport system ATPase subunit